MGSGSGESGATPDYAGDPVQMYFGEGAAFATLVGTTSQPGDDARELDRWRGGPESVMPGRGDPLVRAATVHLVRRGESVALLAQATWIFATGYVDKVVPPWQPALYALGCVHLLAAAVACRFGGPFVRGGPWKAGWVGLALLAPLIMGNVVPYGEYGSSPACVQVCGYPVPPIIFIARADQRSALPSASGSTASSLTS